MGIRLALLAAVAAVTPLAGCGGEGTSGSADSADAEAAVEQAWADFYAAAEERDGEAACAVVSDALAAPGEMQLQLGAPGAGGPSCEETMASDDAATALQTNAGAELENLTVDGATASGEVGAAKPTFAVEDGEWKLTSLSGVPPGADPSSDQSETAP